MLSNPGWRGQDFDIQPSEIDKVKKSAGITCSLQWCIFMLERQERHPSLSAYTELDRKLAFWTGAILSKCPLVSSVNYPLSIFTTNSGLYTIIWLYKCSTLPCVISTTQTISFHIFTKWLKWFAVASTMWSSSKYIIIGSNTISVTPGQSYNKQSVGQQEAQEHFFLLLSYHTTF